jgi:exodeoxyribonuclease V alpha subunit
VWNDTHDCIEHTGLRVGDVVLCTRNLWDRGLQNGSLGTVVEACAVAATKERTPETALAWIEWDDGVRRELTGDMLDDVELGYAVTVHKAQGSQWPRVIVPVTRSRLLDRTLLYTAITRAQGQVILVGDEDAAREAVARPPRAATREVGLDLALSSLLASATSAKKVNNPVQTTLLLT